jgi:hypothetical protein
MAGPIPPDGLAPKLHEIEETRTTGVLAFQGPRVEGEVRLVRGQIAIDQPESEDGGDAVELLLAQTEGTFEVLQRLPPLPVSAGDEEKRGGSLQVHVAADLMNYCERAGLTGWLVLLHGNGDRAEIGYQRGELSGIRLQGPEELHEVFGWEEGHFEVEATALETPFFPEVESLDETEEEEEEEERLDPTLPRAPRRKRRDDTAQHFLRVVEMTLAQVIKDRETHRPASRTGPPLPPMPATRESVPAPAAASEPPKKKREPTIPIVYIDPDAESGTRQGLRHAKRGDSTAEVVLPEAAPERRSDSGREGAKRRKAERTMSDESKATEPTKKGAEGGDEEGKELPAAVWAVIALVVVLLALITLSQLPAFD